MTEEEKLKVVDDFKRKFSKTENENPTMRPSEVYAKTCEYFNTKRRYECIGDLSRMALTKVRLNFKRHRFKN